MIVLQCRQLLVFVFFSKETTPPGPFPFCGFVQPRAIITQNYSTMVSGRLHVLKGPCCSVHPETIAGGFAAEF